MSNIYIIGMRGVGKTTIAKLLSQKLNKEHFDLDDDIAVQEGRSISEIVEAEGWEYFRLREQEAVERISAQEDKVVSTGGGVLIFYDTADKLKQSGSFILLTAEPETLHQRLVDSMKERPSLKEGSLRDEIDQLWDERKDVYHEYADITVATDNKEPGNVTRSRVFLLSPAV